MIHSLPSSEPLTAQKLFSKLYVSYYARLVRFASLYVGAMGDAENIVQDFFLYLWERKEILPELQQPDAYLFSAVKHRCLNFLRSQLSIVDRRQPLSDIMEQEFKLKLYSLQLLDDSQMSIDEVEKQICRAIDNLPERCREIFIRIREEKQSYAQVAEELDISIKTVDAQLQKAVTRLKEMISSSEYPKIPRRVQHFFFILTFICTKDVGSFCQSPVFISK